MLDDSTRDALDLTPEQNADLCAGCSRCCESVSIEIDKPRTNHEYDQWIWVLHHQNLEIYLEKPERWYLHIETKCAHLNAAQRCDIYGRHPVLCREYDPRSCERRAPLSDIAAWFKTAADLEQWLAATRPAHYKRMMAWRKDTVQAPPRADARRDRALALARALVTIGEPAAPASGGREPATRRPAREAVRVAKGPRPAKHRL